MGANVFTAEQVEQFIEEGHVLLRDAFPRDLAAEIRRLVIEKCGAREDDPSTFTVRRNHITDAFPGDPWMRACTPRYEAALDQLMGAGRWIPIQNLGWWPVLFPGFDSPPWHPLEKEWHVDGGFFHHHLDSPEQGMLPIFVFSDIGPGDGGTAIAPGSHKVTARVLRDAQPDGLSPQALSKAVAAHPRHAIELHANAGDIAFLHPFMLHTVSTNVGNKVRVICNPHVRFTDRMNVTADPTRPTSAVEEAIHRALREPAAAGTDGQ